MAIAKSDDRNQGLARCYIQGNVVVGFSKTKMSAPTNKNSDNN